MQRQVQVAQFYSRAAPGALGVGWMPPTDSTSGSSTDSTDPTDEQIRAAAAYTEHVVTAALQAQNAGLEERLTALEAGFRRTQGQRTGQGPGTTEHARTRADTDIDADGAGPDMLERAGFARSSPAHARARASFAAGLGRPLFERLEDDHPVVVAARAIAGDWPTAPEVAVLRDLSLLASLALHPPARSARAWRPYSEEESWPEWSVVAEPAGVRIKLR
jgi:hypothetical protein